MIRQWFVGIAITFFACIASAAIEVEQTKTEEGMAVWMHAQHDVPMVKVALAFDAGAARDGDQWGIAALTAHLIGEETEQHDKEALSAKLASLGSQFSINPAVDNVTFVLTSLSDPDVFTQSMDYLTEVLTKAKWTIETVDRLKAQTLTGIAQQMQTPDYLAAVALDNALYGDHPYAHPSIGTDETVKALDWKAVNEFYKQHYFANNAVLVIVGDVNQTAKAKIADLSKALGKGGMLPPISAPRPVESSLTFIEKNTAQTHFYLAQLASAIDDPDRYSWMVGNEIFGGSSQSRLMNELRENAGWVYGAYSAFMPKKVRGPWAVMLNTAYEHTEDALDKAQEMLALWLNKGPTDDELKAAKQRMIGRFVLANSNVSQMTQRLVNLSFYGLSPDLLDQYPDNINAVTRKDILRVYRKAMGEKGWLTVQLGKKSEE